MPVRKATSGGGAGDETSIIINEVRTQGMDLVVVGLTPLLLNRISEKARHELFMPAPKKNKAEKAMTLKHNPYEEYRDSVYSFPGDGPATRLLLPGGCFRKAISTAALDVPGATKAEIGRLVRIQDYNVAVYGVPQLSLMIVRQADIKRTPDVRSRAIVPHWGCRLRILFASPRLKEATVYNLAAAAGQWIGVGDGRNEKGSSLSCGAFRLTNEDDEEWKQIQAEGGRAAQDAALLHPQPFDQETQSLLGWYDTERLRRDGRSIAPRPGTADPEKVKAKAPSARSRPAAKTPDGNGQAT